MEELLYGAAYYPEYEPEERTEKDLKMMKDCGMNVVRMAESTWSTWEPREGEFDFSILKSTLDLCEKYNMKVIIGTPTYAVPAWLAKKHPEVIAETHDGRRPYYGARQIVDIADETYRHYCEIIIRKLMKAVAPYKCVIGFQLDNETKDYDTCGPKVQEKFKEYLKQKYVTVEALNQEYGFAYWSNSIADWDDLPDVRGTINGSYWVEFKQFQKNLVADFLMWQRRIIDDYRRDDQFVTHNFDCSWNLRNPHCPDGYSYGVQPGSDHQKAAGAVTLAGTDIYHPSQDYLTGAEISFIGDKMYCMKYAPYMVLETQAQAHQHQTPYPGQIKLQAVSHLASGAMGVEYWHWHSIHNSAETYWKGVLSHDMEENAVYRECQETGQIFRQLSPYLKGFKKTRGAALVVSNLCESALQAFPISKDLRYNDVVRKYYDAMYRMNIPCDVIDVSQLPDVYERYSMIVTPALYSVSEETIQILRKFTEDGGTLISSFKSFFTDENVKVWHDMAPHHLNDVFGMHYQEITDPGTAKVLGDEVTDFAELLIPDDTDDQKQFKEDIDHFFETEKFFEATESGEDLVIPYQHKYWGRYAAVTGHDFGVGRAYYIGCGVSDQVLELLLSSAAETAGADGEIIAECIDEPVSGDDTIEITEYPRFPYIIKTGENAKGEKIAFIMNYNSEEVRFRMCTDAEDILTGEMLSVDSCFTLPDWGFKVLKICSF